MQGGREKEIDVGEEKGNVCRGREERSDRGSRKKGSWSDRLGKEGVKEEKVLFLLLGIYFGQELYIK